MFGWGSAIWSEVTDSATCFASEAARSAADRVTAVVRGFGGKAPGGVRGAKPPENFQDFMIILDRESTCKWHCNKKSNSHSGCKNGKNDCYIIYDIAKTGHISAYFSSKLAVKCGTYKIS